MIRIIAFIIIYILNSITSSAQIKSEEILLKNQEVELPGTLTYTHKNTPLIIWVHGSGNVDRNGNQAPIIKTNYIKQFRDDINQHDIAFFSYNKRTSNKKNTNILSKGVVFEDFISDLETVINHFKKQNRFSEIIIIGHSQGSLIAMLASKNVDKIVSLVGPSLSADAAIIKQISEKSPFLKEDTEAHFKELKETGEIKNVNPMLATIFQKRNQSFLKSWMQYNPSLEITKVTVPILIINGDKDLQVGIDNAKALHAANSKSNIVIIKNMNHVLKNITTNEENQQSYLTDSYKLAPQLVTEIIQFIKE